MNKKTTGIVLIIIILGLGIYVNMSRPNLPDLDISIQVNLKVTSQSEQGT